MNKILVVGSSGKVGSVLVQELVQAGESVRAATRNAGHNKEAGPVEQVRFDFKEPSTFAAALEEVDRVFLMQPPGDIAPDRFMTPFVEQAARSGCKIVLLSSPEEFNPLRAAERAIEASGARFVVVYANWFMDNFHTYWLQPIQQANVIPLPAADSRTSFVDVRDVAAAVAAALRTSKYDGQRLEITGLESLTYHEAAAVLSKVIGREIAYVPVDDQAFTKSLTDVGMETSDAEYLTALFRYTREGDPATVTGTFEELTGRKPRTLQQYAEDHADVLR